MLGRSENVRGWKLSSSDWASLRLTRRVISEMPLPFLGYTLVAGTFALVSLLPARLLYLFTTGLQTQDASRDLLLKLGAMGAAIAVSLGTASFGKVFVKEWLQIRLEIYFRRRLLRHFHALPLETLESAQRGDWLTRITGDVRTVEDFLGITLPDLIYSICLLIGTSIILIQHSGVTAMVALAVALILAAVHFKIQQRVRPLMAEMRSLYGGLFQILIENLEGWKTIRSYHAQEYEYQRAETKLSSFARHGKRGALWIALALSATDFLIQILVGLCLVVLVWEVARGGVTVADALFYPFYLGQFFYSSVGLVVGGNAWNRFSTYGGRVAELLDLPTRSEKPIAPIPGVPAAVRFSSLEIGFSAEATLVRIPELQVSRGEIVAVAGPSGAGKSTILEVLSGVRSARSGQITFTDGKGKVVWSHQTASSLMLPTSCTAYVDQKPYIFEGTLQENLCLGGSYSEDALYRALAEVSLSEAFSDRGGLKMKLTDRGSNVSEGQLYRIGIARALLAERPFLLLDEPFSALDESACGVLVSTLHRLAESRAILVVVHHAPAALRLNRIYSVSNGVLSLGDPALSVIDNSNFINKKFWTVVGEAGKSKVSSVLPT